MVSAKIITFLYPFFVAKFGQKKVFNNVLDRFVHYKNIDFKKLENWHLFKVVNPW